MTNFNLELRMEMTHLEMKIS